MTDSTLNARLLRLAEMLDRCRPAAPRGRAHGTSAEVALIEGIPDERLRKLIEMLKRRVDEPEVDAEDAMLIRLLLDDYSAAVRDLRSVVLASDDRLNAVRGAIDEGHKLVESELERAASAAASPDTGVPSVR